MGFLTLYTAMKVEQIGRSETLLSWTSNFALLRQKSLCTLSSGPLSIQSKLSLSLPKQPAREEQLQWKLAHVCLSCVILRALLLFLDHICQRCDLEESQ